MPASAHKEVRLGSWRLPRKPRNISKIANRHSGRVTWVGKTTWSLHFDQFRWQPALKNSDLHCNNFISKVLAKVYLILLLRVLRRDRVIISARPPLRTAKEATKLNPSGFLQAGWPEPESWCTCMVVIIRLCSLSYWLIWLGLTVICQLLKFMLYTLASDLYSKLDVI